jgi:hypothetical protein
MPQQLTCSTSFLLHVQALVDAWAGSAAGKAAAEAAAAHKHISRTPSGMLALGAVNAGPVAGWARWAACSNFCRSYVSDTLHVQVELP